ncbi:MAG TPA: hypothetical protein VH349_11365 [Ktedonobacterales bacterium]|jgi:hypothetical protein
MPTDDNDRPAWDLEPPPLGANGHSGNPWNAGSNPADEEDAEVGRSGDEEAPAKGHWVTRGGVLFWEEPETYDESGALDLRAEAASEWAADELNLPLGAPDTLRIRALRAWLARRRIEETDTLGILLLERRRLYPDASDETAVRRQAQAESSPLDLEMLERQSASEEYERYLEQLADLEAHGALRRLLVEFYLALTERIAELANMPAAPEDFAPELRVADENSARGPVAPEESAEWRGRSEAAMLTQRRVERVTAPEEEE